MNKIIGILVILILIFFSCYIKYNHEIEIKRLKQVDSLDKLTPEDIPADSLIYWE